jgi:AcrR family transcriptional regulator
MRTKRTIPAERSISAPSAPRPPKLRGRVRPHGARVSTGHSRGRPRNRSIDREVVTAVLKTLRDGGYGAVTLHGIARKVKRARTSLYRRWPSKRHLVAYSVLSEMGASPAQDTGTLRGDLQATVANLLRAFAGPLRQALPGLVTDMAQDVELAETFRREIFEARRRSMRAAFARARARDEARDDLALELLLDMLTAPFYHRVLFGHAPVSPRMASEVVEYVLRIARRD